MSLSSSTLILSDDNLSQQYLQNSKAALLDVTCLNLLLFSISAPPEVYACDIFVEIYIKRKIQCDKFIDISFTHFGTLPEEILPARLGVRLLSSTCHIS